MKYKVNVSGSTVLDGKMTLEDQVVIVLVGPVTKEGTIIQATAGRVETRTISVNDALVLTGSEAKEMAQRVLDENQETDLTVINGDATG